MCQKGSPKANLSRFLLRRASYGTRTDDIIKQSLNLLQLFKAGGTDTFSLKVNDFFASAAENAGRLIFGEYYSLAVGGNFNGILFFDIKDLSHLHRQNHSAEFVDFTNNSRGFHFFTNLPFPYIFTFISS